MPNWCSNKLKIDGPKEKVAEFFNKVKSAESAFDFNMIVPMPESLQIESGSSASNGIAILDPASNDCKQIFGFNWKNSKGELIDTHEKLVAFFKEKYNVAKYNEIIELGKTAISNIAKYGFRDWYEWSRVNWGTKWNSGEVQINNEPDIDNYEILFNTAWSPPLPIVKALGNLFPDLLFTLAYYEEGMGFAGICNVHGEEFDDDCSDDRETVKRIAHDEFGYDFEEYEDEDDD